MRFLLFTLVAGLLLTACEKKRAPDPALRLPPGAAKAADIHWRLWGPEAFAESEMSGKPVFAVVRSDVCYWCDVLDRTVFTDDRVISFINERTIPMRLDVDDHPEWLVHYGYSLPTMALMRNRGDVQATADYLQPSELIQRLRASLNEQPVVRKAAHKPRFNPSFGLLDPAMVRKHLYGANFLFDFEASGYGFSATKTLSLSDLEVDVLLAVPYNVKDARTRSYLHIESLLTHLYDPVEGGFLRETSSRRWTDPVPEKHAVDQARTAALLYAAANLSVEDQPLPQPVEAYHSYAAQALSYLTGNLISKEAWVYTGEVGKRNYYLSKKRQGLEAPRVSKIIRSDVNAETALWLSRAGRWSANRVYIEQAGRILGNLLEQRTESGLFWHLPLEKSVPDRLVDAEAALAASLELYMATAEERWLNAAEGIAEAMEPLFQRTGYAAAPSSATQGLFVAEIAPDINLNLARSLWKLGVINNDEALRNRARRLVEAWAGLAEELEEILTPFIHALWTVSQAPIRLELPRSWSHKEAIAFQRHPEARTLIRWVDAPTARVCRADACGEPIAKADTAAREAFILWNQPN